MKFFLSKSSNFLKNIIIFIPLCLSKQKIDLDIIIYYLHLFTVFSLSSLLVYLINDFIDQKYDIKINKHNFYNYICKIKNHSDSLYFLIIIITSSIIILYFTIISDSIKYIILAYLFINIIYSLYLKKNLFYSIVCYIIFYNIRLLIGFIPLDESIFNLLLGAALLTFFSIFTLIGKKIIRKSYE